MAVGKPRHRSDVPYGQMAEPDGKTKRKPKSVMVCLRCPKVAAPSLPVTGLLAGRPGWKDCRLFTVLGP